MTIFSINPERFARKRISKHDIFIGFPESHSQGIWGPVYIEMLVRMMPVKIEQLGCSIPGQILTVHYPLNLYIMGMSGEVIPENDGGKSVT